MKRIYRISVLLLLLASATGACKNAATSTNNQGSPAQPPASNSNAPNDQPSANNNTGTEKSSGAAAAQSTSNVSKLFGTYAMSEVHSGGVVNMISQMKTQITFLADGTYSRISMRKGNVYHSDAGDFRVEGNDHLVLLIKFAKQKVHNPPLERRHSFTLSRDGEELKLTSADGKVAVFRKIRKS
ncbi:MAG TPA: hypothetical protein VF762_24035 [Blastocatellia bacterium]